MNPENVEYDTQMLNVSFQLLFVKLLRVSNDYYLLLLLLVHEYFHRCPFISVSK